MSHWPQLLPPCLGSPSLMLGGSVPLPCMSSCGRLSGGGALGSPAPASPCQATPPALCGEQVGTWREETRVSPVSKH